MAAAPPLGAAAAAASSRAALGRAFPDAALVATALLGPESFDAARPWAAGWALLTCAVSAAQVSQGAVTQRETLGGCIFLAVVYFVAPALFFFLRASLASFDDLLPTLLEYDRAPDDLPQSAAAAAGLFVSREARAEDRLSVRRLLYAFLVFPLLIIGGIARFLSAWPTNVTFMCATHPSARAARLAPCTFSLAPKTARFLLSCPS